MEKKCKKCKKFKSLFEFYNKSGVRGVIYLPDCKICRKIMDRARRKEYRIKVLKYYSNEDIKCNCCNEKEITFLTIDHINDNGAEERRRLQIKSGNNFYLYLIRNNFPEGYRVLCWNCNWAYHFLKVCPHKA